MAFVTLKPCLFLDRDGVVIEDTHYPKDPAKDLVLIPEIVPLIKKAKECGFLVVIASNQSGVARGKFTLEEAHAFHHAVLKELEARGAFVDASYLCPYHEGGSVPEYTKKSFDRKPAPGMFLRAAKDLGIDLAASIMVGDKPVDVIEGLALRTFILKGGYSLGSLKPALGPLQVINSLSEVESALSWGS